MCGIVGLIDTVAGGVPAELLFAMRDLMFKRGPDGEGHHLDGAVGMAMRRLSIIDLEHGWQPFFSADNQVVAFQNGEIYNYRSLRHTLEESGYRFTSQSDTEVLAHGYTEWGIDGLLDRVDGMYAITILDKRSGNLYLARDRFGEKPLFYAAGSGRFAYASNLKALFMLPWVSREIDPKAVDYYLALHYVAGDSTLFTGVRRVLPGEYLVIPVNTPVPRSVRYYRPALGPARPLPDRELIRIVEQAVESRLVADVPVGIFLSGGLDSSIVAAIAARKQPDILTFSMGFDSAAHDESAAAELVARTIGSRHHCFRFNEDSFIELLPQVAAALDEPVGDQAMLPLFWLCREARKQVKVVLAGEGADEVFGGYFYYQQFAADPSWRDLIVRLARRMKRGSGPLGSLIGNVLPVTPSGFPLLADPACRSRLLGRALDGCPPWETELMSWLTTSADPLQRAMAADLGTWLPDDLLVKFDRMAMAHSLEGRAPYLHPEVVASGLHLPCAERMAGGVSKVALRRIAAAWLPPEVLEKPKQGFVLPMKKWLKQWLELQGPLEGYLAACGVDFLDNAEVTRLLCEELAQGIPRERLVFALVLLCEWHRSHRTFLAEQGSSPA